MSTWEQILLLALAALVGWMMYRMIRGNRDAFSKANLSKSFTTLGLLALFLIGLIGFCVLLLRGS